MAVAQECTIVDDIDGGHFECTIDLGGASGASGGDGTYVPGGDYPATGNAGYDSGSYFASEIGDVDLLADAIPDVGFPDESSDAGADLAAECVPDVEPEVAVALATAAPLATVLRAAGVPNETGAGPPPTATTVPRGEAAGVAATTDPINPFNGEFTFRQTDLEFPGFGVPFRHARLYRSRISYDGPIGHNWDHTYNQRCAARQLMRG